MKRLVLVGTLVGAVATGSAFQLTAAAQTEKPAQAGAGHTAPKAQPATEAAPTAPEGQMALGTVRIPKAVKADGKPLAAGTYQVRLTTENAGPDAKGQTAALERWAEFVKGGKVVGREVATVVSDADAKTIVKGPQPAKGGVRVDMLKGNDYVRVWINKQGTNYLIHFPVA